MGQETTLYKVAKVDDEQKKKLNENFFFAQKMYNLHHIGKTDEELERYSLFSDYFITNPQTLENYLIVQETGYVKNACNKEFNLDYSEVIQKNDLIEIQDKFFKHNDYSDYTQSKQEQFQHIVENFIEGETFIYFH
jgi:hypothetical protein